MTGFVRPRPASLVASSLGTLALLAALGACASSKTSVGAGGSASVSVSTTGATSPAASPSAAPGGNTTPSQGPSSTASAQPTSPASGTSGKPPAGVGAVTTPQQQLSSVPAGQKLTEFDSVTASADGRTLYVELESMGGACGQYNAVLQQSSTQVGVGLVHLSAGRRMCPQFVGPLRVAVALSAPIGGRPVLDLADGQRLNVG